ncbi:MAG: FAD-binding oxidoreductase [Ignavibacteria bacterium]|nr:FAD-binding oxidoreductase [Ignavibacteria bacterium]
MKTATIVGGGIFGVAAANMLHENGYDVTIIDHRGIGQGTTCQSTEMLRQHHSLEHELWCSLKTFEFVREHNLFTPLPYLFAYYDEDNGKAFKKVKEQQLLGWEYLIDIDIYNQEESLLRFPFLKKQVNGNFLLGTSTCSGEGRIDVNSLVNLLFQQSKAPLVKDWVLRIEENGEIITKENGTFTSDIIIVAAGPWTRNLLGNCGSGDFVDITPVPYYTFKTTATHPIPYMVVLPDGLYLHPEHPELPNFAVGGICAKEPSFIPTPLAQQEREDHVKRVNEYLTKDYQLDQRCEPLTAGCYDITPTHSLFIEKSVINSKIIIFGGGNGHGIMMAIGAAMLLEVELELCNDPKKKALLMKIKSVNCEDSLIL